MLVAAIALVAIVRRHPRRAAAFVGASVPAINLRMGQLALPNSVLAKTGFGSGAWCQWFSSIGERLTRDPLLPALVLGLAYLGVRCWSDPKHRADPAIAVSITIIVK